MIHLSRAILESKLHYLKVINSNILIAYFLHALFNMCKL